MAGSFSVEELQRAGIGAFFRPQDVLPLGVTQYQLQRMVEEHSVEKVAAGLYRLVDVEATDMETIAMVASAAPHAIVCLLSALRAHEIGTQSPRRVWLAIDRKARKPLRLPSAVNIVRFSNQMLTYGVITKLMQGVPVRITSPARTVIDCFRYRNKIGLDVALEALRDAVHSRKVTMDEMNRAAEVCRIGSVMAPYLEALSA